MANPRHAHPAQGHNPAAALKFIQELYLDRNNDENKVVYVHVTDATNTSNIKFVWQAAKKIVLENSMKAHGFDL